MGSRGIQDLPQEIFHIILDYVGNNKAVLRSCSLVCRSWLQASRPRLFATVSLYACERRLVDFLHFLDTHADITNHVRSLMLHKPMDDQPPGVDGTSDASVTPSTLVRTARRLPRLRELQLYFVHIVPSPPRPDVSEADAGPPVYNTVPPVDLGVFHVFGSAHQEIGPFLEMLAHFRTDRLELELVTFVPSPTSLPPAVAGTIYVRDLWADLETADDAHVAILSSLASALSPGTLQALHCSWREWSGSAPVGQFIKHIGTNLTDLTLNMTVKSWVEERGSAIPREEWAALCLETCARVRTFRVNVAVPTVCAPPELAAMRRAVASYRNLLAGLPASVHTVVMYMSSVALLPPPRPGRISTGRASPVSFHEIEEVLAGLPGLRKFVVAVRFVQDFGHSAAAVAKAFPRLQERGVLEVRSGSMLTGSSSW